MVTTFPLGYSVPTWLQRSHLVTTSPHGYNVPKTLQFNDFNEMTPVLLVMTYDMTKAFVFLCLYFQKFINELSFFFSQDYFPAVLLCLPHSDLRYLPCCVIGLFFN